MKAHHGCAVVFVLTCLGTYAVASLPDGQRGMGYILVHVLLTLIMVSAIVVTRQAPKAAFRWFLFAGIAARILLVGVPPFTTHDVDRYLFDGKLLLEGYDPYVHPPRVEVFAQIYEDGFFVAPEHREYPTIYPPLALGVFAICAKAGPVAGLWCWKILLTLASLWSLFLVGRILHERGRHHWFPLFALSPIAVLEVGVGAHVDGLSMLGVSVFAWCLHAGFRTYAAAGLGAAILTKLTPIAIVLGLWLAPHNRRVGLLALGMVAAIYGIFFGAGLVPVGSLFDFANTWRFGSVLGWPLNYFDMAQHTWIYGAVMLLGALILTHRLKFKSLEFVCGATLAWILATSPVLFPWYALGVLPLIALAPSGILVGWISALPFTYEVIDAFDLSGVWAPSEWPGWVLLSSVGLGMVVDRKFNILKNKSNTE